MPHLRRHRVSLSRRHDYGLLFATATVPNHRCADEVQRLLAAAGIRSTIALGEYGRLHVLVFAHDAQRSYTLLCEYTE